MFVRGQRRVALMVRLNLECSELCIQTVKERWMEDVVTLVFKACYFLALNLIIFFSKWHISKCGLSQNY